MTIPLPKRVLEAVILTRLGHRPGCEDAISVVVERVLRGAASNWRIVSFDSGASDATVCRRLEAIAADLATRYELKA